MKFYNYFRVIFFLIVMLTGVVFPQSVTLKLSSNDNTSDFTLLNNSRNLLQLFGDGGYYNGGVTDSGYVLIEGAGARLMWNPFKASFRAGEVTGTQWDIVNTGLYSAAFGYNTTASGENSFAAGLNSSASGNESVALGNSSTSNSDRTLSINGTASAVGAIAIGSGSQSSSDDAIAIGTNSIASGLASIVIGSSTASGSFGTAIGYGASGSGNFSTAIGKYSSTESRQGSMVISDGTATSSAERLTSAANNQLTTRFVSGYNFYSAADLSIGVTLPGGGNSWSSISDSAKKENFLSYAGRNPEYFLNSLSRLRLGSWNYKSQDSAVRHYGPMAQEIYHYFGKDSFGVIGNDTTLASADMDGIMMLMLKALEQKTSLIAQKNAELQDAVKQLDQLEKLIAIQKTKFSEQQSTLESCEKELTQILQKVNYLENSGSPEAKFTENKK